MFNGFNFMRIIVVALFMLLSATAIAEESTPLDNQSMGIENITAPVAQAKTPEDMLRNLAAKYEGRLQAMENQQKHFDNFLTLIAGFGGAVGVILLAGGVVLVFFTGKTFADVNKRAEKAAKDAIDESIRGANEEGKNLSDVIKQVEKAREKLGTIEKELVGYTALRDTAKAASEFDPLIEYYAIRNEIVNRRGKSEQMSQQEDRSETITVDLKDTIYDPEFRQRAAVVFERLLRALRADQEQEKVRLSADDLYNIAANASMVSMNFVSLELMELADQISGHAPKMASRLIDRQLQLGKITQKQAKQNIAKVLQHTPIFDTHLVVSEASNIGVHSSDMAGMADVIKQNLPEQQRTLSYVLLNSARLKLNGCTPKDWQDAENTFKTGIAAMQKESPSARWYQNSIDEIRKIVQEQRSDFVQYLPENLQQAAFGQVVAKSIENQSNPP